MANPNFERLKKLQNVFETIASQFNLSVGDFSQRYMKGFYRTIIDKIGDVICLCEGGRCTSIPDMVRSVFEAYIDIANLCKYEKFYLNLNCQALEAIRNIYYGQILGFDRQLLNKKLPDNVRDELERKRQDYESRRKQCDLEMKEYQKGGYPKLKILKKCQNVNQEIRYHLIFGMLCDDAHNNPTSLAERYDLPGCAAYEHATEKLSMLINIAAALFSDSTGLVSQFFDANGQEVFNKYNSELSEMSNWGDESCEGH